MQRPKANVKDRRAGMAEEIRKAEEVREALLGLDGISKSYPIAHEMRVRLESMDMERVLDAVEEDIRIRRDALIHPHGT